MVSPVDKQGALISPITEYGVIQAAADGGGITYVASAPTELGASGNTAPTLDQIMSRRGKNGWETQTIATPHDGATDPPSAAGNGTEYKFFTQDLSLAAVQPLGPYTSLSSEDSERTAYIRHNTTCQISPGTCYEPLVTGAPGHENVPLGTKFGGTNDANGNIKFEAATPDLSHVILKSEVGLTDTPGDNGGLYEWAAGKLQLVSILPEDEGGEPAEFRGRPWPYKLRGRRAFDRWV